MEGLHRGGVQTTAAEILPVTLRKAYDQMVEHGEIDADLLDETEISDLRPIFDGRAVDAVSLSSKQYALADVACANEAVEDVIELLRDHFHFEGPVCGILPPTPQAMQDRCPIHEPLRNLRNGHDIAMMFPAPEVQLASIHAVHAAYEAGVLDADSSARSAERVERLRAQSLAWTDVLTEAPTLETHVEHHLDIVRSTYRDSITTLQETPSPLADFPQGASVLLFTPFCPPFADRESSVFEHLAQGTLPADWDLPNVAYNPLNPNLPPDFFRTITGARGIILVLASTTTLMRNQQQLLLGHLEQALRAEEARRGNSPTRTIARVVVGAADVRDLTRSGLLQIGWWGIASWGWSQAALEEAAKVLLGERRAIGRSPITRP
ncbi:hypothetical protein MMC25_007341 [Agyrium rufum]|nr:hypothetical protein [Agyrium rufum]